MDTCGKCRFGQVMPKNMATRMCFGAPPQVLIFPSNRPEGIEVRACRPVVGAGDRACGKFKEAGVTFDIPVAGAPESTKTEQ